MEGERRWMERRKRGRKKLGRVRKAVYLIVTKHLQDQLGMQNVWQRSIPIH